MNQKTPGYDDWFAQHAASMLQPEQGLARVRTVDRDAFIVQACHYDFNIRRLDRYLVLCNDGKIKPVVILSKTDLLTADEVEELTGQSQFETKTTSATGEGRHTTSRRQLLIPEDGTMLIDTPGMREPGLLGADEGLDSNFADIADIASSCRFADCTHTEEALRQ